MSDHRLDDQPESEDGFGSVDRTARQEEVADINLDDPTATDNVPWSPPDSVPIHSEFPDERAEETIDQRIAQEVPEEGTAYGAPEPEGILGGADDLAGRGRAARQQQAGGEDPDAIPAERDFIDGDA